MLKELSGIIIAWRDTRAYWSVPMEESDGNMPPDCYSLDARTGEGEPGGNCHKCPNAEFGSGSKGEGQACKLVRQLFLVREDNLLPEIVHLPPSSLKPARSTSCAWRRKACPATASSPRSGGEDQERSGHRLCESGTHLGGPPDARADQAARTMRRGRARPGGRVLRREGLHLRRVRRRGPPAGEARQHQPGRGAGRVITAGLFWADVDVAGAAHKAEALPPTEQDARSLIETAGLAPSLVVHSGFGLQPYWLFREPYQMRATMSGGA